MGHGSERGEEGRRRCNQAACVCVYVRTAEKQVLGLSAFWVWDTNCKKACRPPASCGMVPGSCPPQLCETPRATVTTQSLTRAAHTHTRHTSTFPPTRLEHQKRTHPAPRTHTRHTSKFPSTRLEHQKRTHPAPRTHTRHTSTFPPTRLEHQKRTHPQRVAAREQATVQCTLQFVELRHLVFQLQHARLAGRVVHVRTGAERKVVVERGLPTAKVLLRSRCGAGVRAGVRAGVGRGASLQQEAGACTCASSSRARGRC
eukprot:357531-Chlamydomonas_euryale.AAC.1